MLPAFCDLPLSETPDVEPDATPTPADPREPMRAVLYHCAFDPVIRYDGGNVRYERNGVSVHLFVNGWALVRAGRDLPTWQFPPTEIGCEVLRAVLTALEYLP